MLNGRWNASRSGVLALLAVLAVPGLGARAWGSVTATITVSGSEQPGDVNAITLSFNGFTETVPYGPYSTPASVASAFGAVFSRDYLPGGLCAIANGPVVSFKLQSGSFSALSVTGPTNSFQVASSGFASPGGTADSGTITLTVGGVVAAQTSYGAGATTESVAAGLAAGVTSNSDVTVTAEGSAVQLQSKQTGSATNYSYTLATTSYDSADFSQPSFMNPSASGSLEGGSDGGGGGTPQTVYSYLIPAPTPTTGYAPNGNLLSYTDSATGQWTFSYDNLNRVTAGTAGTGPWSSLQMGWSYDSFGNRTAQTLSGSPQAPAPQPEWATYTTTNTNRMDATNQNPNQQNGYDADGDVINDGINQYAYDAEGRVCAVYSGVTQEFTGYLYDGLGNRIAKGTLDPMKVALPLTGAACDITKNGFVKTNVYVPGPNGEQLGEADSNMNLQHSNVYANGRLLATVTPDTNVHYAFNDWLGTKRVVASASGTVEETCLSLPFGDELDCNGADPSEQHFTGKERDTESGNDYFGARYYGSSMGRMLSPDPLGGDRANPQSLNRYAYALNNPLRFTDPTGMYVCKDGKSGACSSKQDKAFERSRQRDLKSKNASVRAAAAAYGDPGKSNGVTVAFGDPGKGRSGTTTPTGLEPDPDHPGQFRADINVTFRPGQSSTDLDTTVGHEGQHVEDAQGFAATVMPQGYYDLSKNLTELQTEINAYHISNDVLSGEGVKAGFGTCGNGPCVLGYGVTNPDAVIRQLLANPANGYGVTPANPGPRQFPEITTPNPVPQ